MNNIFNIDINNNFNIDINNVNINGSINIDINILGPYKHQQKQKKATQSVTSDAGQPLEP